MATWSYVGFAVLAGLLLPVQIGINAELSGWVGSPVRAALVSFIVGTLVLLALTAAFFRGWPGTERLGEAPWWVWLGGVLGAFYVLGSIVAGAHLGAVVLLALLLAGQALSSLVIDHYGLFGFEQEPITAGRVLGLALLAAGVVLVRVL